MVHYIDGMVPTLVYDDDCQFCTWAATVVVRRSDIQPVELSVVQDGNSRLTEAERRRLPEDYAQCAHLITEETVYSCGAAMEQSLVRMGLLPAGVARFLRQFQDYERLRERLYRLGADNRDLLSKLVGREPPVGTNR